MKIDKKILARFVELSEGCRNLIGTDDDEYIKIKEVTSWSISVLSLIQSIFGKQSIRYTYFNDQYEDAIAGDIDCLQMCIGVFESAYNDYRNGFMFDLRTKIKAEIGDDLLEDAKQVLDDEQKDIACFLIGVSLELALKELCEKNNIVFTKNSKVDQLNIELRKANVFNETMRKQITAWLGLRNNAAHGQWDQYIIDDVKGMFDGVQRFIGLYLN